MLSNFRAYRRWRGGRWARVNGWLWGKRWIRVPDACVERVDEDYRRVHRLACIRPLGCDCRDCLEKFGPIHPRNVGRVPRTATTRQHFSNPRHG